LGGSVEDTTGVRGGSESDVTGISPSSSPGVLDENVFNTLKGSVSDSEDTVIKLGSTSSSDDTTGVTLESELIGFNGNGDWS